MSLFIDRTATFSPCRRYRYTLSVRWSEEPLLVVCGLNPSTADENVDDPTLRRVRGFARDMGRGGVLMLNAFAWRSTDPRGLLTTDDPVGPDNSIYHLNQWIKNAGPFAAVAAWGANIATKKKLRFRLEGLGRIDWDCFRQTKAGHPEHPLYLPADLRPVPWNYKSTEVDGG